MTWLGVDHVKFNGFRCEADGNRMRYRETNIRTFKTRPAWATNTVARLKSWGFNALGAGCDVEDLKGLGLGRTSSAMRFCSAIRASIVPLVRR